MSAKTTGGGKIHQLDAREVKHALHEAVMSKAGYKPNRRLTGFFIQAELKFDSDNPDLIIGARVWYTKELETGQDPEKAVKVW